MYIVLKFNVIHFVDIRDSQFYVKTTFTVSPSKTADARIYDIFKSFFTHASSYCVILRLYGDIKLSLLLLIRNI